MEIKMATSITKTYSITIKYSRDDEGTLTDTNLEYTELREHIMKKIEQSVPASRGILSAHISGSVSEA